MRSSLYYVTLAAFLSPQLVSARPQSQWKDVTESDSSDVVRAAVAFHQPRLAEAEDLLMSISDPTSDKFGQYLNTEEVVCYMSFESHYLQSNSFTANLFRSQRGFAK
jgi:tripeptidyl-peptidase-1